jgi:hypothetical protein
VIPFHEQNSSTTETPRRIIIAIYAACTAPGELLGILSGAALVTIELGLSVTSAPVWAAGG